MRSLWLSLLLAGCFPTQNTWDPDGDGFCPKGFEDRCPEKTYDCDNDDPKVNAPTEYWADRDGDGFGDPTDSREDCEAPPLHVDNDEDCNDDAADEHPGATWYADSDGDGYGIGNASDCKNAPTDVDQDGDCDDNDADNWSSCSTCVDTDSDTYFVGCDAYTDRQGPDCDDTDDAIYPGATEICDGIANACGATVPADETDDDGDGWVECANWVGVDTGISGGDDCSDTDVDNWVSCASCVDTDNDSAFVGCDAYTTRVEDCDDGDPGENPGITWYADADGDGHGDPATSNVCERGGLTNPVTTADDTCDDDINNWTTAGCADCADSDGDTYYGGCDDYVDFSEDCDDTDGDNWVSCTACVDTDNDGAFVGCDQYATLVEDCNDTAPEESPLNVEVCEDGFDNDCVGGDASCSGPPEFFGGDGETLANNIIEGAAAGDGVGTSMAAVPDVDGDRRSDLLVGSFDGGSPNSGRALLFVDVQAAVTSDVSVPAAAGGPFAWFDFSAEDGDGLGYDVAAGNVGGDSGPDLVIAARCAGGSPGCPGQDGAQVYVILDVDDSTKWPRTNGRIGGVELSGSLPANVLRFTSDPAFTLTNIEQVAVLPDVDGNGYDELAIADIYAGTDRPGLLYVLYGPAEDHDQLGTQEIGLETLDTSSTLQILGTYNQGVGFGIGNAASVECSVDAWPDLVFGASDNNHPGASGRGSVFMVRNIWDGGSRLTGQFTVPDDLAAGLDGEQWTGVESDGALGGFVSLATDDTGCASIAVNKRGNSSVSAAYWIPGGAALSGGTVTNEAITLLSGTSAESTGYRSVPLGDVDNDGLPDIAVSAPSFNSVTAPGAVYVHTAGVAFDAVTANAAFTGSEPGVAFGREVVGLGDLNGDAVDDFAVMEEGADDRGRIFVFFGGDACVPTAWTIDSDGDGYGDDATAVMACTQPGGMIAQGGDCDDTDTDNWLSCSTCLDNDGDGAHFGCDAYTTRTEDCDDNNPNAWSTCLTCLDGDVDGYHDGCDAYVDVIGPDCDDADGDNWVSCSTCVDGDSDGAHVGCDQYVDRVEDCNDGAPEESPLLTEVCADGLDNDCDAGTPDACGTPWYADTDGDSWGDATDVIQQETQPVGYVAEPGDCNDAVAAINPGAFDFCGDGVDSNCDGLQLDARCTTVLDTDTHGLTTVDGDGVDQPLGTSLTTIEDPGGQPHLFIGKRWASVVKGPWIPTRGVALDEAADLVTAYDYNGSSRLEMGEELETIDFDGDGQRELFVGSHHGQRHGSILANPLGAPTEIACLTGTWGGIGFSMAALPDRDGTPGEELLLGERQGDAAAAKGPYVVTTSELPAWPTCWESTNGTRIFTGASVGSVGTMVANLGDIDGDGEAELAASDYTAARIWVEVAPGAEIAVSFMDDNGKGPQGVNGVGDLDLDGYDDYVVGGAYSSNPGSAVFVLFGRASWSDIDLDTADPTSDRFLRLEGVGAASTSGIRSGDLNRDGWPDLVFGQAEDNQVYVVWGPLGPGQGAIGDAATIIQGDGTTSFGKGVEVADFDQDGWPDLAVASNGAALEGRVHVIWGSVCAFGCPTDARPESGQADVIADGIIDGATVSGELGLRGMTATSDIDGDGLNDLLVGANEFAVLFTDVANRVSDDQTLDQASGGPFAWFEHSGEAGMLFGNRVASGNVGGGPGTDLIFGAKCAGGDPGCTNDGGRVFIVLDFDDETLWPRTGGRVGAVDLNPTVDGAWPRSMYFEFVASSDNARFGHELLVIPDLDGDGYDELLMTDNNADNALRGTNRTGAVWLAYGPVEAHETDTDGIVSVSDLDPARSLVLYGATTNQQFGVVPGTLAQLDCDANGDPDLAIGGEGIGYEAGLAVVRNISDGTDVLTGAFTVPTDFGSGIDGYWWTRETGGSNSVSRLGRASIGLAAGGACGSLLASDPEFDSSSNNRYGRVYRVEGSSGLVGTGSITNEASTFHTGAAEDYAGSALAVLGDIDADGLEEFAIAANGVNGVPGSVLVGNGEDPGPLSALLTYTGDPTVRAFGAAVAGLGDVSGDGVDDFAVSSATASDEGRIYVFFGGPVCSTTWYADLDGDGYGDDNVAEVACSAPVGFIDRGGDCDDSDATIYDGAPELCDGVDNDCDTLPTSEEVDPDGDKYVACTIDPGGWDGDPSILGGDDCDPLEPLAFPTNTEVDCDGIDNDCVGGDGGSCGQTWYADGDGDGVGDAADTIDSPTQPPGYVAIPGDCDDDDSSISPLAAEICGDGRDTDCARGVDDGCDGEPDRAALIDDVAANTIVGSVDGQHLGTWLTAVPDIDGDGKQELFAAGWNYAAVFTDLGTRVSDDPTLEIADGGPFLWFDYTGTTAVNPFEGQYAAAGNVGGGMGLDLVVTIGCGGADAGCARVYVLFDIDDPAAWPRTNGRIGEIDLATVTWPNAMYFDHIDPNMGGVVSHMGWGVTVHPDVDGDGYDELSFADPAVDSLSGNGGWEHGAVWLIYGPVDAHETNGDGAVSIMDLDPARHARFLGETSAQSLGQLSAASGNFDCDGNGYADLAFGVQGKANGPAVASAVAIIPDLWNGTSLLTGSWKLPSQAASAGAYYGTHGAGTSLGRDMATVPGTGCDDLAVGAPGAGVGGGLYLWPNTSGLVGSQAFENTGWAMRNTEATGGSMGTDVAWLGDIDGDGIEDVAVSAPRAGNGVVEVLAANARVPTDTVWLTLAGDPLASSFGEGLAAVGDQNGDGYPDFAVSDFGPTDNGRIYLVLGGPCAGCVQLTSGEADALIYGNDFDRLVDIWRLGDIDGDGFDDLMLRDNDPPGGVGNKISHLVYGPVTGTTNLATSAAASFDFGPAGGYHTGTADINGDTYPDILISDPTANSGQGAVSIFHGGPGKLTGALTTADADAHLNNVDNATPYRMTGFAAADLSGSADIDLAVVMSDTNLHIFEGPFAGNIASNTIVASVNGISATALGDFNGDSTNDVIAANSSAQSLAGVNSGEVSVLLGPLPGVGRNADTDAAAQFYTSTSGDLTGQEVYSLGDVDGAGRDDLVFTSPEYDAPAETDNGAVFGMFGAAVPADADVGASHDFAIIGAPGSLLGTNFHTRGSRNLDVDDVDGDGRMDILVGEGLEEGQAYLFFGDHLAGTLSTADADVVFTGPGTFNAFPRAVGLLGDVRGDGSYTVGILEANADDPAYPAESAHGAAYLFFGHW